MSYSNGIGVILPVGGGSDCSVISRVVRHAVKRSVDKKPEAIVLSSSVTQNYQFIWNWPEPRNGRLLLPKCEYISLHLS